MHDRPNGDIWTRIAVGLVPVDVARVRLLPNSRRADAVNYVQAHPLSVSL